MCLTALEWTPESKRPLILAFNRDEYYERPTEPAHFWQDKPHIYASRDSVMGGTWLACSTTGRMAALTNFHCREDKMGKKFPRTRGEIPVDFCDSNLSAVEYAKELEMSRDDFKGFSIMLFDGESLVYCCNRSSGDFFRQLTPGTYGLSNHVLDTPWPKVERTKRAMSRIPPNVTAQEVAPLLMEEFTNPEHVTDTNLIPKTLGEEMERYLSAVFVQGPDYGTRTTSIISFTKHDGFDVLETNFEGSLLKSSSTFQHIKCIYQ